MRLYLNLKNGISEIEASETPVEGFTLYDILPVVGKGKRPPETPDGVVYHGPGPLRVVVEEGSDHIFAWDEDLSGDGWDSGFSGDAAAESGIHYALRRGTEIARANGIPDQP